LALFVRVAQSKGRSYEHWYLVVPDITNTERWQGKRDFADNLPEYTAFYMESRNLQNAMVHGQNTVSTESPLTKRSGKSNH